MFDSDEDGGLTTISLSNAPPSQFDRRTQERQVAVLRVAKLRTPHGEELCKVRNISSGGLMAHVYSSLDVGDAVTAEFKSGHPISGKIIWRRAGLAGMAFDEVVNAASVLSGDDFAPARQPRAPRLGLRLRARMRVGARYHAATLCDISQGGAKIEPEVAEIGQKVVLMVTGLPAITGVIRWHDRGQAGIQFDIALPFDTLAQWAATVQHRPGTDQADSESAPL
ncbi:PilZ domain-containing protein [Sphingomonas oligophenolica]|uniref:PilZ domain-containing protein n=2 Tax=Sphingomonas oligophenolica TaxID=301154 RepID=A0ABU9Y9B6_9SPHN